MGLPNYDLWATAGPWDSPPRRDWWGELPEEVECCDLCLLPLDHAKHRRECKDIRSGGVEGADPEAPRRGEDPRIAVARHSTLDTAWEGPK